MEVIHGRIAFFGFTDWWLKTFTESERLHIREMYQPLGGPKDLLVSGTVGGTTQTRLDLLIGLASWFSKPEDCSIARRVMEKAEALCDSEGTVLDRHFMYSEQVRIYYRNRDAPEYMELAERACRLQIDLAPQAAPALRAEHPNDALPCHAGYEQLAIILEKRKEYATVIELCGQAKVQGWCGSWDARTDRCKKKQAKENQR